MTLPEGAQKQGSQNNLGRYNLKAYGADIIIENNLGFIN